ncbi:MAG: hypothetical protein DWQ30_11370 [Acidobacteria bacterium]|nr:MAG: hypothetical protein DWQ30_11370 [Acidobacteriota bacterium]
MVGCVFFVLWFLSGLVMLYVEMPYLPRTEERLAGARPLSEVVDPDRPLLGPAAALQSAELDDVPGRMVLSVDGDEPVWRLASGRAQLVTVAAGDGRALGPWNAEQARERARDWLLRAGWIDADAGLESLGTVEVDQWTLDGFYHRHRPLHRFGLADGRRVHVGAASGEVVQGTTRRQRLLAYLGPVTHWLYPTWLRSRPPLWSAVVVWLSGLGIVTAALGLALGVLSLRRGGLQAHEGWLRWHHVLGLAFGTVTLTWVFSGWLSMDPVGLDASGAPTDEQVRRMAGGPNRWDEFELPPERAVEAASRQITVRELEPVFFAGAPFWVAYETPRRTLLVAAAHVDGTAPGEGSTALRELPAEALRAGASVLVEGAKLVSFERLEEYDHHYLSKRTSAQRRPLPVYRARYDDAERTILYIDPHRGRLVQRVGSAQRLDRFFYRGLHSLDFAGLVNRRPLWDVMMIVLLLGGLALSLTSIAVASRRARRWLRLGGSRGE